MNSMLVEITDESQSPISTVHLNLNSVLFYSDDDTIDYTYVYLTNGNKLIIKSYEFYHSIAPYLQDIFFKVGISFVITPNHNFLSSSDIFINTNFISMFCPLSSDNEISNNNPHTVYRFNTLFNLVYGFKIACVDHYDSITPKYPFNSILKKINKS